MKVVLSAVLVLLLVAAEAGAQTEHLAPGVFHDVFSAAHAPVLTVASGTRIATAVPGGPGAGFVGPIAVEGAEPGDLLVVRIESLTPGAMGASPGVMTAGAVAPGELSNRDVGMLPWMLDAEAGVARLDLPTVQPNVDWAERYGSPVIELPLMPALSGLGVAPGSGDTADAATVGPWGGSLDFGGLTEGALVLLPVFESGALLYVGPGRARQGDGLAAGAGIETSMDVELGLVLVPRDAWPHSSVVRPSTVVGEFEMAWPRVETADMLMAVAAGPTLDEAVRRATLELHHWLDDDFGLNEVAVSTLMGQALEYEIARVAGDGADAVVVAKVSKASIPVPVEPVGTFPPGIE